MKTIKTLKHLTLLALLSLIPMQGKAVNPEADKAGTFTTGKKTFLLNDRPFLVKAAELIIHAYHATTGSTASRCAKRWE